MADGNQLVSSAVCKNFTSTMGGEEFQADVMLVPLGSCEMILGVQWLSTLGPILWDFDKLKMEFNQGGKPMVIQGTQLGAIQWVEGKTVQHVLASCTALQIFAIQVHFVAIEDNDITRQLTDPSITQLLD